MRVFVTGGTGFLGSRLVPRLLREGHDVYCLLRRRAGDASSFRTATAADGGPGRLEVVTGSLAGIESVRDLVRDCDAVIHAAAGMSGGAAGLFATNVVATRRLIALVPGSCVKRFVLVSSLGVYAAGQLRPGDALDESTPLDPEPHRRDPYSYSKIAQERVAWASHARGNLPLVVIRPGVIYGPGRGTLSARIGLRLGRVLMRVGGEQQVPYTYVDNCADAVALALTAPGLEGHAVNVVDDEPTTAREVLRRYRRDVGRLHVVPIPRSAIGGLSGLCEWYHGWSKGQLPAVLTRYRSAAQWGRLRYPNDNAKLRLGWSPIVSLAEGLRLTNAWSRAQHG